MNLSDLLQPEAVKVLGASSSKKRLMHDLGDLSEAAYGLKPDVVVDALMVRESLGPTGVGQGIALPHARLPGLQSVCGAFILLEKAVDFDSVDRQPVDLVFALFAPEDSGIEHLKALALVSRTFRDAATCQKLRANKDASTLFTILTSNEGMQAA